MANKTLLLFILLIAFNSCKKEIQVSQNISGIEINQLKQVYTSTKPTVQQLFDNMPPDWNNIYSRLENNNKIFEISLSNPNKIFQGEYRPNEVENAQLKSNIRLIISQNLNKSSYRSFYMSIIADDEIDLSEIHYKNFTGFSGKVLFYTLKGEFINGWYYNEGKIIKSISASTKTTYDKMKAGELKTYGSGREASLNGDKRISRAWWEEEDCVSEPVPTYGISCVTAGNYTNCQLYQNGVNYVQYCTTNGDGGNEGEVGNPPVGSSGGDGEESDPLPPEYICNCECEVDQEMVDANLSYEPKWGQLGNLAKIKGEITKLINQTNGFNTLPFHNQLQKLRDHFEANRLYTRDSNGNLKDAQGSEQVDRYIYTANSGWIDMHHFFFAASVSESNSPGRAFLITTSAELIQQHLDGQQPSAFSYEDLPSNYAGILFWKQYSEDIKSGSKTIVNAVSEYLNQLSPKEPSEAPNYAYIPHIIDNYVPRNRTSKGLTGEDLKNAAKASFCQKPQQTQKNIIEAHEKLSPSSTTP